MSARGQRRCLPGREARSPPDSDDSALPALSVHCAGLSSRLVEVEQVRCLCAAASCVLGETEIEVGRVGAGS